MQMDATDKLTMLVMKQHDHIRPTLKALPPTTLTSGRETNNPAAPRHEHAPLVRKRSRLSSFRSDGESSNSHATPTKGMSIFKLVAATRAWQRLAKRNSTKKEEKLVQVKLENTYKTKPDNGKKFSPEKVERCLKNLLEAKLDNVKYTPDQCRYMITDLSTIIKSRVKAMDFPRYRIVCHVIIMENLGQGTQVASRCLWDPNTDSFATCTYRNESLIAVANVYAVYLD